MRRRLSVLLPVVVLLGFFWLLWRPSPPAGHKLQAPAPVPAGEPSPSPSRPAPAPARPDAAAESSAPEASPVEGRIRAVVDAYAADAEPEAIRKAERELEDVLARLGPGPLLALFEIQRPPVVVRLLLRRLDGGLQDDRPAWEEALAQAVERALVRRGRLEEVANVARGRLRDETRRDALAREFLRGEPSDLRMRLAAQFAAGPARAEVREFLWSRAPERGAVEGLGYLLEPDEAVRLEAFGPQPHVIRALETAYERTRDPAFKVALGRLGR